MEKNDGSESTQLSYPIVLWKWKFTRMVLSSLFISLVDLWSRIRLNLARSQIKFSYIRIISARLILNCTFIVSFASFDFEIGAAFSAIRITTRLLLSWERNCLRLTNRLSILLPSKLSSNNNAGHILSASFLPRFLARPPLRLVQLSTAEQHFLRRAARLVWVEFGRWQKCLRREKFDEILSLCLYWDWKYTEEWLHSQNLSKLSFKAQHKFETSW